MFFIRLFLANSNKKIGDHCARLIEKEHLFCQPRSQGTLSTSRKYPGNLVPRVYSAFKMVAEGGEDPGTHR